MTELGLLWENNEPEEDVPMNACVVHDKKADNYFVFMTTDTGKTSLPIIVKNYKETRPKSVIIYVGQYFGIFPFFGFLQIYAECILEVRRLLDPIMAKI